LSRFFVSIAVGHNIHVVLVYHTTMSIMCGRTGLPLLKTIVVRIQHILPAMCAVDSTGWAPFSEEQNTGGRIVAR